MRDKIETQGEKEQDDNFKGASKPEKIIPGEIEYGGKHENDADGVEDVFCLHELWCLLLAI